MSRLYDRAFIMAVLSQTGFVLANSMTFHYARWIGFLGGGTREIGWIMGAGAVAGLVLRPWMGQWINRIGMHRSCALGFAIFAAGAAGSMLLSRVGWEMALWRSCFVLGAAFVFAGSLSYVSQVCPPERRTEAIGILGAGGFLGMLVGPCLGDFALGAGERERAHFDALFLIAIACLALAAAPLYFLRDAGSRHAVGRLRLIDFLAVTRRHWPGTVLLVHALFGVCLALPTGFLVDFIDARDLRIGGISPLSYYFLGYAGWGLFVRVASRRVPDRRGRRKVLLAGIAIMGLGMLAYLPVTPERAALLIVPGLICGMGHALMFHTMTSLALDSFPREVRGTGSALSLMVLDVGTIGGAPIIGLIADAWGYRALFVTLAAACFLVAAIYLVSCIPVWLSRRRPVAVSDPPPTGGPPPGR